MEISYEYSNLSQREFAEQMIARIKTNFDVDLKPIFENETLDYSEKIRKARLELLQGVFDKAERDGYGHELVLPLGREFDREMILSKAAETDIEPNMSYLEQDWKYVRSLTGADLHNYVYTLAKRFENMQNAKTEGQLAIEIVSSGLLSIGVSMTKSTIQALRTGQVLLAAVRTGVTSIGMGTVLVLVSIVLVSLLLYLFFDNPKRIMGIIINNTDTNFVVKNWQKGVDGNKGSDLFMEHGEMVNFMEDNEDGLQSPKVQLKKRIDFGKGDNDNSAFGGIFYANRNIGLRGSEGVMIFTPSQSTPTSDNDVSFAYMFAVPYVNDNGTNIELVKAPVADIEQFYRKLYDSRKVRVDYTSGQYQLTSTVEDPRGGVIASIAVISKLD